MEAGLAEALILRLELIFTVTEAVPVQPDVLVPVTLYVVAMAGLTTMLELLPPVLQL